MKLPGASLHHSPCFFLYVLVNLMAKIQDNQNSIRRGGDPGLPPLHGCFPETHKWPEADLRLVFEMMMIVAAQV